MKGEEFQKINITFEVILLLLKYYLTILTTPRHFNTSINIFIDCFYFRIC